MSRVKSLDWWTKNLSPWSGCLDLALPPEQRKPGCRKCWLPSLLSGPRGKVIHGDHAPHEIVLHPGRLAQALRMKAPQRFGYINGEVADVAKLHLEYLAACVGVALARPDHGFGVPTSDPGPLVEWARWLHRQTEFCQHVPGPTVVTGLMMVCDALSDHNQTYPFPPPNWLWLLSISTQQEADERLPYGVELGRMGWHWGVHAEPMLSPLSIIPDAYGTSLADMPDWVVAGAAKGHRVTAGERGWYESIRDQCAYAGVPFWLKSPEALPGEEHRGLPAGWPT